MPRVLPSESELLPLYIYPIPVISARPIRVISLVDDRAGDRDSAGQVDGAVPVPAGEGCV